FIEKDKFIIQNTDGLLLIYDEENEGSPKYIKRLAEKYMESHDYNLLTVTAYDLQLIAEEIQQQNW
ncbi:MAG: SLOG family protein, partial [Lactobacillus sp.]|nr:SLOG family protein [Lactobacillus sp.]